MNDSGPQEDPALGTSAPNAPAPATSAKNAFQYFMVISLCLVAIPASGLFILARPAFDRTVLSRVRPGMTKAQVSQLMGQPENIEGAHQWEYSRWGNAGWVEISFDENDVVLGINDESVFPP